MGETLEVCCASQRGPNWGNTAAKSCGHPGSVRQKLAPGFVTYNEFLFQSSYRNKAPAAASQCGTCMMEKTLFPSQGICAGAVGMVGGGKRHQSKSVLFPAAAEQAGKQTLPFLPKLQAFQLIPFSNSQHGSKGAVHSP